MAKRGPKKGVKYKKTLEKEIELEAIRQRVMRSKQALINAQMGLAKGLTHLYVIYTNKKGERGRPELITDQETIEAYLADELENTDHEYYFMSTKDPDNKALDSLLDRTFGKAPQSVEVSGPDKGPVSISLTLYGDDDRLKTKIKP